MLRVALLNFILTCKMTGDLDPYKSNHLFGVNCKRNGKEQQSISCYLCPNKKLTESAAVFHQNSLQCTVYNVRHQCSAD